MLEVDEQLDERLALAVGWAWQRYLDDTRAAARRGSVEYGEREPAAWARLVDELERLGAAALIAPYRHAA